MRVAFERSHRVRCVGLGINDSSKPFSTTRHCLRMKSSLPTKAAAPAPLTAAEQAYRDEYQKVLELGFLGDRAFWPRSENDDFHTDWREYPGFDHKLDGKFKYRFDKTALRSPKEKPAGYVFGVWKLKDKQSQVKTPEIKINPEALEIVRKIMKRKNEEAAQKIMDKIRDEDKG